MEIIGVSDILVFIAFVVSVITIGLYKSTGEETHSEHGAQDYFLAGRGLTWWLIGFSLIAANISTEQFVGMSGKAADWLGMAIASYEWMAAITLVVVAFLFLPEPFGLREAADLGMYAQTLMLAMTAHGLGSCPQTALSFEADCIRATLGIDASNKLLFGISFGYPDPDAPVNNCATDRAAVVDAVCFHS